MFYDDVLRRLYKNEYGLNIDDQGHIHIQGFVFCQTQRGFGTVTITKAPDEQYYAFAQKNNSPYQRDCNGLKLPAQGEKAITMINSGDARPIHDWSGPVSPLNYI